MKYTFTNSFISTHKGDWFEYQNNTIKTENSYFFVAGLRSWFLRWVFR